VAVHVGADVLESPKHAGWARLLSCHDTVERLTRVCHAAGVRTQQHLLGRRATVGRIRDAIAGPATRISEDGVLVLTFSGHSERAIPGEHHGSWCLRDGVLRHTETVELLAGAPPFAHIVVIAETCYAAAFAAVFAEVPAATVLLAACAANQSTLNYPRSEFAIALERFTFPNGSPNPQCTSYTWLRRELRKDTPDVERPAVLANRPEALRQRPFQPLRSSHHRQVT
jgi:hypothetical protein